MKEHLELGITERFGKLVEKVRGEKIQEPKDPSDLGEQKKSIVEWALKSATTRVVLARDIGELSDQLRQVATDLDAGKDAEKIDGLRAAVMLKVAEVVDKKVLTSAQTSLDQLLKTGDVTGAVDMLKKLSKKDEYRVDAKKQKEVEDLLDSVLELDKEKSVDPRVIGIKAEKVIVRHNELGKSVEKEIVEMTNTSEKIEADVQRKFVEGETKKAGPKKVPKGKIESSEDEVERISMQASTAITGHEREIEDDKKFIRRVLSGGGEGFGSVDKTGTLTLEVDKYKNIGAQIMYARTSTILGRHKRELSKPENKELREYLENLQFELRERLMEIEGENIEKRIAKGLIPGEVEWEDLNPKLQEKIIHNGDFVKKYRNGEDVYRLAEDEKRMNAPRSKAMILKLIHDNPELGKKFDISGEDVIWTGEHAEDFFELCRREIYKIKDVIPEERLGNLVFEEKAQLYLALMGVSSKGKPEIRQAKDAVTKMLYMEFALKSLWKAGGNHEAWQRAGGLLLRDEAGANFFLTMKIREKIRGKTKDGKMAIDLPGFNVDDIMTIGELAAPNGQSWLAYISTDNIALNERRLQELGGALTEMSFEKAELIDAKRIKDGLNAKLTSKDTDQMKLVRAGEVVFDQEQLEWIRNYTHYMHTTTLNAGEKLWLMDAMKPGDKGFDYASIPGGQFAEKSGLFGVLYFAKYSVTKYGYEALGKLFVPNHGLLSFARGETFRHFFSAEGNEAWLEYDDKIPESGKGGARDFFFKGKDIGKDKMSAFTSFWEEVWLDRRTGTGQKTKGMRAVKHARDVGRELITSGKHAELIGGKKVEFISKHKEFIGEMDFVQLENKLGHEIPGSTNEEKLLWTVDNLSYDMLEVGTMPSKREADWLNKYSKNMTETDIALQAFLDAPTLANKMKILESVMKYNNGAVEDMSKMLSDFMEDNRKVGWGPTVLKRGKDGKVVAPTKDADGGNMTVETEVISPTDGWYLGRGLFFTRQAYKEGTNDPMIMRKLEIQNAIAWGIVDAKVGGQMMRDWQKDIYFGGEMRIGRLRIRPAMTGVLAPYLLLRGWWVDQMGLDWADFNLILGKQNEETFGKLMKLLGLSG